MRRRGTVRGRWPAAGLGWRALIGTCVALPALLTFWLLTAPSQGAAPPRTVTVTVTPSSIPADGTSQATATATVTDANGKAVSGDAVVFSSSDPKEKIGATAAGTTPGTYTASITSSTTAGTPTITATDSSVTPSATGTTTLTQTAGPASSVSVTVAPPSIVANGTSTSLATATVTDANHNPVSGDSVVFTSSDPGEKVSATSAGATPGTYTASITSSTTIGSPTITATDTTGAPPVSGTASLTQTSSAATTMAVALSPSSILANGASTATATAAVTDANHNPVSNDVVVFTSSDPGEKVSQTTNDGNGLYSATIISSTAVGAATITATDTSVTPALNGTAVLSQAANASSTSLSAVPSTALTNQSVILIATVTSSATSTSPAGLVTFMDGLSPIPGCTNDTVTGTGPSVTVTCKTSVAASASPAQLEAVFTPSNGQTLTGSTSATLPLVVGKDPTSTSLDVSNPAVKTGTSATYTATVTMNDPGSIEPTGTVEFMDGGNPISSCSSQPLSSGTSLTATCTVTYTQSGSHSITAAYSGDANFNSSTSSPAQSVNVSKQSASVLGTITSTMQWTFFHTQTYTKVLALVVNHAPVGGRVIVSCSGRGCPFKTHSTAVKASATRCSTHNGKQKCTTTKSTAPTINLLTSFRNRALSVGASIIVEVVRPHWIGKHYRFTVRRGQPPGVQIACLAPGATRPGVGC